MMPPWRAAWLRVAPRPRATVLVLGAALAGAAALAPPAPALVCSPSGKHSLESLATVDGTVVVQSGAALVDTVWTAPAPRSGDAVLIGFDYAHGDLVASANGTSSYDVKLWAPDRYELLGVPLGTPVTLGVELQVTVGGCCEGTFLLPWVHAALDGTDAPAELTTASVDLTQTLAGTVTLPAWGREFWVCFLLEGGNGEGYGGAALVTGHWRFTGLPAGASLVSCKGFAGDVVPTRPTTWGALKARYR